MARLYRTSRERSLRRLLPKNTFSWIVSILVLLGMAYLVTYMKVYLQDSQTQTFPVNQLERGFVSRKNSLRHMNDFLVMLRKQSVMPPVDQQNTRANRSEFSRDLQMLQSLGLTALNTRLNILSTDLTGEKSRQEDGSSDRNNSFSRHLVTHRFCYTAAKTPQGNHRQVDPSFCARLISLLHDIQHGGQPSLITVFTWLPDPLYDADKLKRRVLFENWSLLRPIVEPVLFTDSRVYMALANSFGWPCFPVSSYSSQGVPVFKHMARTIDKTYNSTFYGYARATTTFDASLVETLLKLQEIYVDKLTGNWTGLKSHNPGKTDSKDLMKPVLIYGRALRASGLRNMKSLQHMSHTINTTEGHAWPDRKDALTYFFYSNLDFSDIPDLIVEDKYLTSQLVSRSMALGHLVVDASATLYSVHIVRGVNTSEWGREYLHAKPRDPYYNKRLGSLYLHSQGMTRPAKRLHEVATKFSTSGHIFIGIRSGAHVSN